MAQISKKIGIPATIICIDTWLGAPEFWTWGIGDSTRGVSLRTLHGYPRVYYTFLQNVKLSGHDDVILPFPISSMQAVDVLKYYNILADLIYIDAAHEYNAVKQDIQLYWEVLKTPHSHLFGDDFNPQSWPGVVRAVTEFAQSTNKFLAVNGVMWSIRG